MTAPGCHRSACRAPGGIKLPWGEALPLQDKTRPSARDTTNTSVNLQRLLGNGLLTHWQITGWLLQQGFQRAVSYTALRVTPPTHLSHDPAAGGEPCQPDAAATPAIVATLLDSRAVTATATPPTYLRGDPAEMLSSV